MRLLLLLLYILFVCSQKVEMELSCFWLLGRFCGPWVHLHLRLAGGHAVLFTVCSCLLLYTQGHWLYVERLFGAKLGCLARGQVRPLGRLLSLGLFSLLRALIRKFQIKCVIVLCSTYLLAG